MAQGKFRFVSPGIQLRELDRSQIPDEPEAVGPVIIGRAQRGPALRPVKVQNFTEFVEIFGEPLPGGAGGDIWRKGGAGLTPTYGAYAAQAWLANGSPLTYVRLLGQQHTDSTATARSGQQAGWWVGGEDPDGTREHAGALGLFVCDSASAGTAVTGTLACVWYCTGSSIELSGAVRGSTDGEGGFVSKNVTGSGILIKSSGPGPTFTALVKDNSVGTPGGDLLETISFNIKSETAGNFARNVFNTNPTKLTTRLYDTGATASYFLGETFERDVRETLNSGSGNGDVFGFIASLYNKPETEGWSENYASATPAQTPWIIAQDMGASSSYSPENNQRLFQIKALDSGEWTQENLKISIRDIRYSVEPSDPWGSFSLLVRKANDSDEAPKVVESFANLSLNPNDPNYIARRIGDKYAKWDDSDRRFRYHGRYPNASKFIYVEMKSEVDGGGVSSDLLPFGYQGPPRWGSFGILSGSTSARTVTSSLDHAGMATPFARAMAQTWDAGVPGLCGERSGTPFVWVGSGSMGGGGAGGGLQFTASFNFPRTYMRGNTTEGNLNDPTDAYFGVDTTQYGGSTRFDNAYQDVVRGLSTGIGRLTTGPRTAVSYSAQGNVIEYSYVFSLDDITNHTGSETGVESNVGGSTSPNASQTTDAYYLSGSRAVGLALSCTGTSGSVGGIYTVTYKSYHNTLDSEFNKFTVPMFGGFNGVDIQHTNPFDNYYATTPTMQTYSKFNSIRQAIDSCADAEMVECNLMTAPGVGTTTESRGLTNHMLDICERRADTLAVIDIEGGYLPPSDRSSFGKDSDSANQGKASTAATTLRDRKINNSYGACYYPWIQIRDSDSGVAFFAPPSIAAIGTYAYSEAQSEVWYAPAGFNRGGLTEGAGGVPIIGVTERLSSKDRDKLYENNINPIASFPAEGLVVFGQKTLQATRSALDRVNVRRLLIHIKKEVSRISSRLLFDPNTAVTWDRFTGQVAPFLDSVKVRLGLEDYKVVLDSTTTTPDLIDRNVMYAKIFLKPTRAIEFIAIDFIITNTGASFED